MEENRRKSGPMAAGYHPMAIEFVNRLLGEEVSVHGVRAILRDAQNLIEHVPLKRVHLNVREQFTDINEAFQDTVE